MTRTSLQQTFLLIDISIPPQKIDIEMLQTLQSEQQDVAIVFTKIDKVSQKERAKNLKLFQQQVSKITPSSPPLFFVSTIS
ncbi:MAG: hypothetical protein LBP53_00160 [Candidatus Peribacteria bacterium]|jgi:GTP-binding protein|nr:hypothetical protein [Candidatus Peribacteria bacterium]